MTLLPSKQLGINLVVWRLLVVTMIGGSLTALAVVVGARFPGLCRNDVAGRFPSPDGQLELIAFERDCGATTGFSTQASILPTGVHLEDAPGNLFSADTNHGAAPEGPGGGPELHVRWLGNRVLSIAYHERANVYKSWRRVHGVRIDYSTFR